MEELPASAQVDAIVEAVQQSTTCSAQDPTMQLLPEEKERALEIKAAVEVDQRVQNLTDYEYVQYALTTTGDALENVRERVYRMQAVREEYGITDDATQGVQLYHQMTMQHPGMFLAVDYLPQSDNFIIVLDYAAFVPPKTDEEYRIFMAGFYYLHQATNSNFRAIRVGVSCLVECSGAEYRNLDLGFFEKFAMQSFGLYPMNVLEEFYLNSESTITLALSIMKRFLPQRIQKKIHLGHRIEGLEGTRIDVLYKTPTEEAARERMVLEVLKLLTLRYQHQKNFSLSEARLINAEAQAG